MRHIVTQHVEDVPGTGFVQDRNGRNAIVSPAGKAGVRSALIQWGESLNGVQINPRYCWSRRRYVRDMGAWIVKLADGRTLTVAIERKESE